MRPDVTLALSVAVTLGVCCVGALRVVDLNEKEPLWALGLLVWLGVIAAACASLISGPERTALGAAVVAEAAKAGAIAAGVVVIVAVGRRRGIPELNSVLDCLLYGAAAGAGFAIGDGFLRATYAAPTELQSPDPRDAADLLWMTVQSCFTEAAFGAILGAAIGGAFLLRRPALALLVVPAGLALAVATHSAYAIRVLETGVHAPGVSVAGVVAVGLVVLIAGASVVDALVRELRIIRTELAEDEAVTDAELQLLARPGRRQRAYAAHLAAGRLGLWMSERRLHNRQVSLAFALNRARSADGAELERLRTEVRLLRADIAEGRRTESQLQLPAPHGVPLAVGLGAAAAALVIGIFAIQAAAGEHPPSTFATRTSLAERERERLEERAQTVRRSLRPAILALPASWRLEEGHREPALLRAGAREAYRLALVSPDYGKVSYVIARFTSVRDARDQVEALDAPRDAHAWASEDVVHQVRGSEDARWYLCVDVEPDRPYSLCPE